MKPRGAILRGRALGIGDGEMITKALVVIHIAGETRCHDLTEANEKVSYNSKTRDSTISTKGLANAMQFRVD